MCGIAGLYAFEDSRRTVDCGELVRIRDAMSSRGPDGEGMWCDDQRRIGLAHRRLAIIDLSPAAAQPMADEVNGLTIVFNGEIYNYRELRASLEARGCRFRTHSDTEVLLAAYASHGAAMVDLLRGMFAFAIWDGRNRRLFLARDPLGIKPLYYSMHNGTFRFASQVKALRAGGAVGNAPSPAGHVGFFLWGQVPDPHTLYADIHALPAGSTLVVDDHGVKGPSIYWSVSDALVRHRDPATHLTPSDRKEKLREELQASVSYHMVADVPVGVFLSSGRDSATLLGLTRDVSKPSIRAFTLGFREFVGRRDDETALAHLVAERFHAQHQVDWVSRDDFLETLEDVLAAMDQPSIDGINVYMVSRAGRKAGIKVALTGIGADELFGGYSNFRQIALLVSTLERIPFVEAIGRPLRELSSRFIGGVTSPKYSGLLEYGVTVAGAYFLRRALFMPWELDKIFDPEFAAEGLESLDVLATLQASIANLTTRYAQIAALEMNWYLRDRLLRDADWASMAHSLEIRVPYVDHKLIEQLAPDFCGPSPYSKSDMAGTPLNGLPDAILRRPKTGFLIPIRKWLAETPELRISSERGLRGWAKFVYRRATAELPLALERTELAGLDA
jgi:asparagine synthase (glutamine-hydrolysing)